MQAEHAAKMQIISIFQLGAPEKLTGTDDPRHILQENGGLADLLYIDDGDILCHQILVPSYLHELDDANDKVGAERNPQKTEIIYCVAELDAAPPEWKIDEVRLHPSVCTVAAGCTALGVAVEHREFILCGSTHGQISCHSSYACACSDVPGPSDRSCTPSRRPWS